MTVQRLSTHVLDTAAGRPAAGIPVVLHASGDDDPVGSGETDSDGRIAALGVDLPAGSYRLVFRTGEYLRATHGMAFYPQIVIEVTLDGSRPHYHVPVLLSPFAYSTYLGS